MDPDGADETAPSEIGPDETLPRDASTDAEPASAGPDRARPIARTRVLIALPLVIALLAAGALLWTRTSPTARGGFCSRATREVTKVIRAGEGAGRIDYNRTRQIDDALAMAYLIDLGQLRDGAPTEARQPLADAEDLLPGYLRARDDAAAAGEPAPEPPEDLRVALTTVLAVYYQTCI